MDVLYCLGSGSKYNNKEIYHSIRLLQKYCSYDRLWIIGERPDDVPLDTEYYYVPFTEKFSATRNVFMKLVTMCQHTDISEDFLYMMDDIFLLKHIEPEKYPLYHSGEIRDYKMVNPYLGEVLETKKFLKRHNKPVLHYGVHCPIVYNKQNILEIDSFYWKYVNSLDCKYGLNPRILYGNWFDHTNTKYTKDLKLTRDYPMPELKTLLKDKEWFSIGSKSYEGNIKQFIEEQK